MTLLAAASIPAVLDWLTPLLQTSALLVLLGALLKLVRSVGQIEAQLAAMDKGADRAAATVTTTGDELAELRERVARIESRCDERERKGMSGPFSLSGGCS